MTKYKFEIIGMAFGVFLIVLACILPYGYLLHQAKKAITACEKNLPRSQTCVITAVPKEGGK